MDDRLPPASADRAKRAKRERHDSTTEHLAKTRRREIANDGEAGTPACSILMDLPDEILFHICRSCWGACVRVRGLNKLLRRRAEPLLHEMNRLRWSKYHYHYVPPHLRSPDEPHSHQLNGVTKAWVSLSMGTTTTSGAPAACCPRSAGQPGVSLLRSLPLMWA